MGGGVTKAGLARLVGIGGRICFHERSDKLSRVLVIVDYQVIPLIVVSMSLITAKAGYSYLLSGSLVHLSSGTVYE